MIDFVVAGLGNPGREYENTRHNVGFAVIDLLAARFGVKVKKLKFKALCGDGIIAGKRVLLLKPQTFMNASGQSVRDCLRFHKLPPEKLIAVFDDATLTPQKIRYRAEGTDGGHNGVKDIIYQLNSDKFARIKLGVGQKPGEWDLKDWVLTRIADADLPAMEELIRKAAEEVVLRLQS